MAKTEEYVANHMDYKGYFSATYSPCTPLLMHVHEDVHCKT